jgi:hypothetical protein
MLHGGSVPQRRPVFAFSSPLPPAVYSENTKKGKSFAMNSIGNLWKTLCFTSWAIHVLKSFRRP